MISPFGPGNCIAGPAGPTPHISGPTLQTMGPTTRGAGPVPGTAGPPSASSESALHQLEGDVATHSLEVGEPDPEEGQRLQQTRLLQVAAVQGVEAEVGGELVGSGFGVLVVAAVEH